MSDELSELRLKIIKSILNEYLQLRETVKKWLLENGKPKASNSNKKRVKEQYESSYLHDK